MRFSMQTMMTTSPFLMNKTVGTLRTPKREVSSSLSSTSHLQMVALPAYSSASSSMMGAIFLHGPHQVAEKSMIKGRPSEEIVSKF